MIDKNDRLTLIDIELAYCLHDGQPNPPYVMGTYGFMSPEQQDVSTPTVKEDIFGLGSTMINFFTGLAPLTFSSQQPDQLVENLHFFIGDQKIAGIITACVSPDPDTRPNVQEIRTIIQQHLQKVSHHRAAVTSADPKMPPPTPDEIRKIIQSGINGLVEYPALIENDLWLSKMPARNDGEGKQEKEFGVSGGFAEGLSGTLYFLAKARQEGFDVSSCQQAYNTAWDYINSQYFQIMPHIPPGVYGGAAGIALALAEGIRAGLLEDGPESRDLLLQCLELPHVGLDLATGIAGQGWAALKCESLIGKDKTEQLARKYAHLLVDQQKEGEYWMTFKDKENKRSYAYSLAHGNTGIILFLLNFLERYEDTAVKQAVIQAMIRLSKATTALRRELRKKGPRQVISGKSKYMDGVIGTITVLIKAYDLHKHEAYRKIAEELLALFSPHMTHDNFQLDTGLAALGNLYLDAGNHFQDPVWNKCSNSVARIFSHTVNQSSDRSAFWQGNNSATVTASLLTGNAGILSFLTKYLI
jgi:hypothetical protein